MPNATTRPKRDYGTAFVHYLLALNLAPGLKDYARESFRVTLFKWTEELDSLGRVQDLFDCYEQALELFPVDEVIVNSMGEHLFRMGFRDEAAGHFHKALKLRPDFAEAKENFYRAANWLVERWHFLMLNDRRRNQKYRQAIQKAVESGCSTVLDIGTGTGILGMCAKQAGAARVYACELSKTMYELACEVVSANGMNGTIKILHKKSLEMEVPKDIPERVSLVVTETVDAGLFGEGIVESLTHAWKHLLLPPQNPQDPYSSPALTGRVIPAGATVFGMALECSEIRRHHRVCVLEAGGLSLCAMGGVHSPVSCSLDADDSTEPYTTERLSQVPGGYAALTEPFRALDIDFNSVQELEGLCSREGSRFRLPVTRDGMLDALAMWFELHLDKETSLSTGPQEDTCWEQAIYPVQHLSECSLKAGDELLVEVSCKDSCLRIHAIAVVRDGLVTSLDDSASGPVCGQTLGTEAELCSALASLQTGRSGSQHACVLESSEIAMINNVQYHESYSRALEKLLRALRASRGPQGGEGAEPNPLYVLDVSEGFSALPLMVGRQASVKAYSSVEKQRHQTLLRRLAKENGLRPDSLEFWLCRAGEDNRDAASAAPSDSGTTMLQRPSSEQLWSAIVLDCVEICGLLRQKLMEKATLARCLLEDGGRIFPERIVMYGQLVESDALLQESAVQGRELTLGFDIAPFINQFTVPVHVFLDLSTLCCKHLSEPTELFVLDLMNSSANHTSQEVKVCTTSAGRLTAIPFWYQLHLDEEISISTFSACSHWKQAAVVLQQPVEVSAGEVVCLSIKVHKNSLSITARKGEEPTTDPTHPNKFMFLSMRNSHSNDGQFQSVLTQKISSSEGMTQSTEQVVFK
uniref:Protein arginine N-methyltransferase 9 n=1 Tax=Paramormyrops kingsleyae TaxID=1676925 RepID=A0A3B3T7N9_9TELE